MGLTSARASTPASTRVAGVTVPLFSLRSEQSWGIGEIGDLPAFAALIARAGISLIQLLPLGEISIGNTSPYSALSAFGIDPMFISLAPVVDLQQLSTREVLGITGLAALSAARKRPTIDYDAVRELKRKALHVAMQRFVDHELAAGTQKSPRARAFLEFCEAQRHWLPDYALYRAIKDSHRGAAWWQWPDPLRERDPAALRAVRARHAEAILYYEYVQWLAHGQWRAARAELARLGVELMGDLPFMVDRDSADVWVHRHEFRMDMSVGVPADQFDEDGQDWGLPPYHWRVMADNDFAWLRRRAAYSAELYDRFRVDHLVGFYRTYMRPYERRRDERGKLLPGVFDPPTEAEQLAHGERVIRALMTSAAERGGQLIAEDLGSIPDYVRPSLARLGAPGYKVLIWEKDGPVFRDPAAYPALSVATFGTHDTAPVAVWWDELGPEERAELRKLPGLSDMPQTPGNEFTPAVHAALLRLICGAGSDLVLLLMQDLLGVRDRINKPGTLGDHNWTWRLPQPIEAMRQDPDVTAALARVRAAVVAGGRRLPSGP
jgi:4-alpha-glucanotransferase